MSGCQLIKAETEATDRPFCFTKQMNTSLCLLTTDVVFLPKRNN